MTNLIKKNILWMMPFHSPSMQLFNCKKEEMVRHKKLCTVFYSFLWHYIGYFKKRGNQLISWKIACLIVEDLFMKWRIICTLLLQSIRCVVLWISIFFGNKTFLVIFLKEICCLISSTIFTSVLAAHPMQDALQYQPKGFLNWHVVV